MIPKISVHRTQNPLHPFLGPQIGGHPGVVTDGRVCRAAYGKMQNLPGKYKNVADLLHFDCSPGRVQGTGCSCCHTFAQQLFGIGSECTWFEAKRPIHPGYGLNLKKIKFCLKLTWYPSIRAHHFGVPVALSRGRFGPAHGRPVLAWTRADRCSRLWG